MEWTFFDLFSNYLFVYFLKRSLRFKLRLINKEFQSIPLNGFRHLLNPRLNLFVSRYRLENKRPRQFLISSRLKCLLMRGLVLWRLSSYYRCGIVWRQLASRPLRLLPKLVANWLEFANPWKLSIFRRCLDWIRSSRLRCATAMFGEVGDHFII